MTACNVLLLLFQSTLPYGSDRILDFLMTDYLDFNPRSLTGATTDEDDKVFGYQISIHAPLRERLMEFSLYMLMCPFQSTLPYGSDSFVCSSSQRCSHFNPRSLTGATYHEDFVLMYLGISIHAPLRERQDCNQLLAPIFSISIHAPLRERPIRPKFLQRRRAISIHAPLRERQRADSSVRLCGHISIHAPLRERRYKNQQLTY